MQNKTLMNKHLYCNDLDNFVDAKANTTGKKYYTAKSIYIYIGNCKYLLNFEIIPDISSSQTYSEITTILRKYEDLNFLLNEYSEYIIKNGGADEIKKIQKSLVKGQLKRMPSDDKTVIFYKDACDIDDLKDVIVDIKSITNNIMLIKFTGKENFLNTYPLNLNEITLTEKEDLQKMQKIRILEVFEKDNQLFLKR
jgi:hypothetical protein